MSQTVFERYEKKYFLTAQQEQALLEGIDGHMSLDRYGETTICNIYFDTEDFDLVRRSVEKPVYKEKLRLRSYGVPEDPDSSVFVEIKKKYEGVVYKRRVEMTLRQAEDYLYNGIEPDMDSQILREMSWFLHMNPVKPQVYLAYDRRAFFSEEDRELRLTLDRNIRCRHKQLRLAEGAVGEQLLPPGMTLMEIKIPGVMPLWMAHLLSDLEIYPASFSKYGAYYKQSPELNSAVLDNHRQFYDVGASVVDMKAILTRREEQNRKKLKKPHA